ncbi:ABC transporter permease [Streptomyces sp. Caat 7-52]|uniref:ABC transporter permease n=1 Tax=Streptomyces sp. Caat 7-52 TaxID=2949637 RepID=UPI0020352F50|nr:ABC transporter permease [Streptomyces sp. Caat 7-52]
MIRLVFRRFLWSIPSLGIVSALTFVLAWLAPGDAARVILGTNTDPAAYEQLRSQLGLDRPLWSQYTHWLGNAVQGDLGSSLFTGGDVREILGSRLTVSLTLVLGATAIAATVGVLIGLLAALRGGAAARAADSVALVAMSTPTFWLSLLLVLVFSVKLSWLPATGFVPFDRDPVAFVQSLILPTCALSLGGIATIAKQTRGALVDVMGQEYVRALRANGLPGRRIILRHCLKNAAPSVITVVGIVMIGLLGGTILVEQVFAMPGMGQLTVTATTQHDLPLLVGAVIYYTLIVIASNLLTDIATAWLSPRTEDS